MLDPWATLTKLVPALNELALCDSQAEAGLKLLKEVWKKLLHSLKNREVNQLEDIASFFASEMKHLKPSLKKKFHEAFHFNFSFTLIVIVFAVSTTLHILFMFVYQNIHLSERLFPKIVEAENRQIAVTPHFHVPEFYLTALPALEKNNRDNAFVFLTVTALPVPKKPATSMEQSVIGKGLTGVFHMDGSIELVDPRMVKSFQMNSTPANQQKLE